jgi:hypothetical protein
MSLSLNQFFFKLKNKLKRIGNLTMIRNKNIALRMDLYLKIKTIQKDFIFNIYRYIIIY